MPEGHLGGRCLVIEHRGPCSGGKRESYYSSSPSLLFFCPLDRCSPPQCRVYWKECRTSKTRKGSYSMQTASTETNRFESDGRYFWRVADVAELEQRPFKVVTIEDRHILLLRADGHIRALDSRCPHMGYPLSQGTIKDGVLRCHWHHWRFDLASGGCFTEGGDDVAVFPVIIRDGAIWVSPVPLEGYVRSRTEKLMGDLRQGMEERN